ncbi:hypothetical protein CPB84DRAFT_1880613 [Gymnopilus junonius]|uniref:Uncharacterized protein n=1 Tax=Gymnopilus junonius TaxID=109634 RepID=A0A9P5NBE0_GYMJU|nr:hypothetical protein CPB84DRAFT_1880613 [Gymnopilus junonius]
MCKEGPLVVGIFINAVLLGVMSTQVYLYYISFKSDRLWMKIFVAVLFICDIVNTVFNIAALYQTLIQHFGDFVFLGEITWLFDTDPALMGIIVTSTQLFFTWRIYALTKRRFLSLLIVFEEITVSAMVTAVKIADAPIFVLLAKIRGPIVVWLSAEVIGDILITLSLVTY